MPISIVIDSREPNDVRKHLTSLATLSTDTLPCGDYLCSERVAVERKTVSDFLSSLRDQRLFSQLRQLLESFECPVLLIEGNPDGLYGNGFAPNAIRGALSAIAIDYRVPILWTSDSRETALQLYWMASREQEERKIRQSLRTEKPDPASLAAQQEHLIAGLPGISGVRARALLAHFKTPADALLATEKQLRAVEGLGPKTAKAIFRVLHERAL